MSFQHFFKKHPESAPVPQYRPGTFMSPTEFTVFLALSKMFDTKTSVLAKVSLAELVSRPEERRYLAHWQRVQRRVIDFLVCTVPGANPILAIQLETERDSRRRRERGPNLLEEVLEDIGLPMLHLRAQDHYDAQDLTKKINFALKENSRTKSAASHVVTPGGHNISQPPIISMVTLWARLKQRCGVGVNV